MEKILIIDDESKFRKEYKTIIKSLKLAALEASNALEAANILMREKSNIALILLDISIPEVDGRGIFEIIEEYAPQIPVVVSSIFPVKDQRLKVPGAREYHNKADGKKVLLEKLKTIL
ncbi:MAG: response regulator [Candidatus Aceula meridiana]|nr:response regulator [Candidatus Aceula meridiana]